MQHIHCIAKPDCVDRSIGVAIIVFNGFKNTSRPKALERFCLGVTEPNEARIRTRPRPGIAIKSFLFQFALEAELIVGAGHARDQEVRGHGPLLHLQNYGRI
jgi:hypothetical protein